ncbi:hypothetical protein LUZ60_003306 [Juncus effusus]|nr:hypothetical protein LUZ60_003306 [Juncus effusus]
MFSIVKDKPLEPRLNSSPSSSSSPKSELQLSEQETKSDERNSDFDKIVDSGKPDDAIELVDSPPTPNFSIRDFAYKSRSKGIETSWPFKPKFLNLCLKNGVKQLLPPFEPPDLIKTRPVKTFQPDPLIPTYNELNQEGNNNNNNSTFDENTPSDTETLTLVAIKDKKKRNKVLIKKGKKVIISREIQETKKCGKLAVKLSTNSEIKSDNLITDPNMASKVCPVCKTFSSSSNTTLNAHIDQCLSMDCENKRVENDILKPKIKPRKKKLLSEIYETALCFTLEDLDRRNGTNWALNGAGLSVEDPKPDKQKPEKAKVDKVLRVEERETGEEREREGREGAVYVDSNGIKIRILSKFEDLKEKDSVLKEEKKKGGKGKFGKKKLGVEVKNVKKIKKMKLEGKKFKPFKGLKTRVQPPRDGKINEIQNKNGNEIRNEETDLNLKETEKISKNNNNETDLNPKETEKLSKSDCLGAWPVRAKRSDTPKKRNYKKNPYKIAQNSDDFDSPSTSGQIPKFSNSQSSNSPNFSNSKPSNSPKISNSKPSNSPKISNSKPSNSPNFPNSKPLISPKFPNSKPSNSSKTLRLKLPKPNGKNDESNREKISEKGSKNIELRNNSLGKSRNSPQNLRSESIIETQVPLSRKWKKHRSILKPSKKREIIHPNPSSSSSRVLHEETDHEDTITNHANKRLKFTQRDNNDNNNTFEQEEEELTREERDEISQNIRGQDENSPNISHNQETRLDNLIQHSKDLSSESSLPTNTQNSEEINAFQDPLIPPQINNNHNNSDDNDYNNDNYDNNDDDNSNDDDDVTESRDINTSIETPQDDSSITSNWDEEMNLERSLANFGDDSDSTMSLSSKQPVSSQPDPFTLSPPLPTDLDLPLQIAENPKKIEEITEKPFICSCRENRESRESNNNHLSKEGKSVNFPKEKQSLPPLYVGPRDNSGPYRPECLTGTGFDFDSPSQSFSTLSQSPVPVPVQVQVPASPSNPILRLMGKNLLVVNQEEITIPPLTPNSCSSSSQSRTNNFMPPPNGILNQNFSYQSHSMPNNSYLPYNRTEFNRQAAVNSPFLPKEVIVIDDSPEMESVPVSVPMSQQQNISILAGPQIMQQSPFFWQNGTGGTVIYPQVGTGYFTQVGPSGGVHEPGPFIFRPPNGYLDPSLYYSSHTMR